MDRIIDYIKERRVHFLFWLPFVLFVMSADSFSGPLPLALLGNAMVIACYAATFYTLGLWILPKAFTDKKIGLGILYYLLLLAAFLGYSYLEWYHLFPAWGVGEAWGAKKIAMMKSLSINYVIITIAAAAYYRHRVSIDIIQQENNRQHQLLKKENELLVKERKMLARYYTKKFEDHLIFNVLNNMYSQVYKKMPEAGQTINQFATLLRYGFKSEYGIKVPLNEEIKYINSYIDLQKTLKNNLQIQFCYEGDINHVKIVPRVLISFVENAIKHGLSNDASHPILVNLSVNGSIQFSVHNYKNHHNKPVSSGIGQEIAKEILNLHYGGKYSLQIKDQQEDYFCQLNIHTT